MASSPSPSSPTSPLEPSTPTRRTSGDFEDSSSPLYFRFKSWLNVLSNLIEYFEQLESYQNAKSKECQKISKTLEVPFKTPEFATDGIATIWQAMKDKANQMSNFHTEEANQIKAGPIAELTRLRGDLKGHLKDLDKEGVQGSKKVGKWMDKFSNQAQDLGKWIPVGETNPKSLDAEHDPYVLWRQIQPRLHTVISEENVLNERLYSLQLRCEEDEKIILQAIQKAIKDHSEQVNKEAQYAITVANESNAIAVQVPPDREWENFKNREPSLLTADHKPLDPKDASFPGSDHALTKPVIEGHLSRKSTRLGRRTTAYYVLSPAGFLLEYPDKDPATNPEPSLCLKLADCELGNSPEQAGISGEAGFTIRGKADKKFLPGMTHDYIFGADGMGKATQWWTNLNKFVGMSKGLDNDDAGTSSAAEEKGLVSPIEGVASPGGVAEPVPAERTEPQMPKVDSQESASPPLQKSVSWKMPEAVPTTAPSATTTTA